MHTRFFSGNIRGNNETHGPNWRSGPWSDACALLSSKKKMPVLCGEPGTFSAVPAVALYGDSLQRLGDEREREITRAKYFLSPFRFVPTCRVMS